MNKEESQEIRGDSALHFVPCVMYNSLLHQFHQLKALDRTPIAEVRADTFFDLARFQRFLDRVGNPEKGLPVIHIAGSKGKGSTAVLLGAALQALGKRTGIFISPYLKEPTESIFMNGEAISKETFATLLQSNLDVMAKGEARDFITSFEMLTVIALQFFHEQDVDFAVVETGMGGRLDATNVIESPILSVICPIEKEHSKLLGNSLTSIAYEKLGIVREETPVVLAHQDHFILEFARSVCMQKHSPFLSVTGNYEAAILSRSLNGSTFRLKTPKRTFPKIPMGLLGDHQVNNAITAMAALEQLFPDFDEKPIFDLWQRVRLPGRFELKRLEGRDVILDGAHTMESARALRRTLDQLYPNRSMTFLLAFLEDKDIEGFGRTLLRPGDTVIVTQVDHPRHMPARLAEERIRMIFPQNQGICALTNNLRIAWQKALKMGRSNPIVITGSFKLLEEF